MRIPRGLEAEEPFEGHRDTLIWMLKRMGFNEEIEEIRHAHTDALTSAVKAEIGHLMADASKERLRRHNG